MKPVVIDPKATARAEAYALWMNAPDPMVTFFKTLDVTPLLKLSRKRGYKFNMLLCWCIGKAASELGEFYFLPVGREFWKYDSIAVNTIVKNKTGEVSSCDVPFSDSLAGFNTDYLHLTHEVSESCKNHDLTDSMVIGTSAIVDTEIDGAFVIDTPGMREIGMWDNDNGINIAFRDIENLSHMCKFSNCSHTSEPGCAIQKALSDGTLDDARWNSYLKLKNETEYATDSSRYLEAKREKFKNISKINKQNRKNRH